MANPIKASDLYQDDGAILKAIEQLQALGQQHEAVLKGVKEEAIKLNVTTKKLNATTAQQREEISESAKQAAKLEKMYDKYNASLSENAREIAALQEAQKKLNQVNRLEAKLNLAKEGSYNALSAQYSLLKIRINQLSKAERENSAEGRKMVKQSREIYEEMKRLQEETGKTSLNVGNYKESIKEALQETGLFPGVIGQTIGQFRAWQGALRDSAAAIGGTNKMLRFFKIALASTGIGAILLVLGPLVAFLTRTQKGIDLVNRVMAGFKAVADVFIDRLSAIGEKLRTDFIGTVKEAGTSVGGFFKSILSRDYASFIAQTTAAAQAIKEVANEVTEEAKAAAELTGALQQVRDETQALEVRTARARAEIKALNLVAEDTTRTFAERSEAAARAGAIERQLLADRQSLLERELAILEQQKALGNSLFEDEQELADKRKEIAQIQMESLELQTTINNKLNTINAEALRNTKALNDELAESAAVLGGPAAEARLEYDKALEKIKELKEEARLLGQSFDFSPMETLASAQYEKAIDAIQLSTKRLATDGLEPLIRSGRTAAQELAEIQNIVSGREGLQFGFKLSKDELNVLSGAFNQAKQNVSEYFSEAVNLANFQAQQAQAGVQQAQNNLQIQLQLADQGLANRAETAAEELRIAEEAQAKAQAQAQRAQRAQLVAQSIQQASNLVTAATKLFAELPFFLALPATGLLFSTFAAAKVKAFQATKLFSKGGYEVLQGGSHASGNDVPLFTGSDGVQRRAEGGEGMAIFSRKARGKYGSILPDLVAAINRGDFEQRYQALTHATDSLPIGNTIVNVNTSTMEGHLGAIRRQGERRMHVNSAGQRVETIGNRTITYV